MKQCANLQEFCDQNYIPEIKAILQSKFANILVDNDVEDVVQGFLCHCANKQVIERFNPEIGVKFSTYMYSCIRNYCLAFILGSPKKRNVKKNTVYFNTSQKMNDFLFSKYYVDEEVIDKIDKKIDRDISLSKLVDHDDRGTKIKLSELYTHYIEGSNDTEIARMLGVTAAGVGVRKKVLVKELQKFYMSDELK